METKQSTIRQYLNRLVQKIKQLKEISMGGTNQATCPPATTAKSSGKSSQSSKTPIGAALNPIRFHEVKSKGEVHFHDDQIGLKCAIDSAAFLSFYNTWRSKMTSELMLTGNNGSGGHSTVTFLPYVDDAGEMQVSMIVADAKIGQTVTDLDTLAHYS